MPTVNEAGEAFKAERVGLFVKIITSFSAPTVASRYLLNMSESFFRALKGHGKLAEMKRS